MLKYPDNFHENQKIYFEYLKKKSWDAILNYAPPMISIPYGTQCNAFCTFCQRQTNPDLIPDDNSLPLVIKSMEKFIKLSSSVYLSDWGEPGIAKYFTRVVNKLNSLLEEDVTVGLATNCSKLSKSMINILFDGKPRFVIISLNASNRKDYFEVMGIDVFETTISNIKYLIKRKSELKDNLNLNIFISIVLTSQNYKKLLDFVKLAIDLHVDGIIVEEFIQFHNELEHLLIKNSYNLIHKIYLKALSIANNNKIPMITVQNSWYLNPPREKGEIFWCKGPWQSFRVNSQGDVAPCCYFSSSCGNVLKNTPEEIWNGKYYKLLRQQWISGNLKGNCLNCKKKWLSK
ncbi:MAG: SPASM domain-containing protein [Promethearchaeota archaeon]